MKQAIKIWILTAGILLGLMSLAAVAATSLTVQVSILPQKYFVERIGGDRVHVDVLVKPGKNPATYSPSPDQMKKLTSSDVYFRIGVPFENGILHKIKSIAGINIIDTRQGIILRQMGGQHHGDKHDDDHTDGIKKGTDDHTGKDPHIWMDPMLVKKQAHTIYQALSALDPEGADIYRKNADAFMHTLEGLDHRLKTLLKDMKGENLFVFHPSFGYFTEAYGLKQVAVEAMGKAPKGKTLSRIIKQAKKEKARVIFVQPQFDRNAAGKIASAINGAVVSIDPLAYDYLANMENIAQSIARALNP